MPTSRWRPGRTGTASAGQAVECPATGEIGFCKTKTPDLAYEKICGDLAREVGVGVPEVKLGVLEGRSGTVAVSLAHGVESIDLAMLQTRNAALFASPGVQTAIRAASGLLAFHAWVRTEDLKNDHLVITDDGQGNFAVAAIDFSYALRWARPSDPVEPPSGPPALIHEPAKDAIEAIVTRIEACTDERISEIVNGLPDDLLSPAERERLIAGLRSRRGRVREAMRVRGWLP